LVSLEERAAMPNTRVDTSERLESLDALVAHDQ
jgi:hypothetical protein